MSERAVQWTIDYGEDPSRYEAGTPTSNIFGELADLWRSKYFAAPDGPAEEEAALRVTRLFEELEDKALYG